MNRLVWLLFVAIIVFLSFSCQQKKEENKEIYINPVFKENLSEVYNIISKRYFLEYDELLKKFGPPARTIIDSVQSEANEGVFDSTFVLNYNKIAFHFYKRTTDKKFLFTGLDLRGDFKTNLFTLIATSTKDEIILLFGDPSKIEEKENSVEFIYPFYKDEEGKSYDTLIFIFVEERFIGINYVPYIEIYPDISTEEKLQQL